MATSSRSMQARRRRLLPVLLTLFLSIAASAAFAADAFAYDQVVSKFPNRSAPVLLHGTTLSGNAYVFITPEAGATRVRFYLDNPSRTGTYTWNEASAPWDYAGSTGANANPFDTTSLPNGLHTITAVIDRTGGTDVIN